MCRRCARPLLCRRRLCAPPSSYNEFALGPLAVRYSPSHYTPERRSDIAANAQRAYTEVGPLLLASGPPTVVGPGEAAAAAAAAAAGPSAGRGSSASLLCRIISFHKAPLSLITATFK